MCFIVIAISDDMGESDPILVDKYPNRERAEEVKADIDLENKAYHEKFAEYYDQTMPQAATELNITDAAEYRQYCKGLMEKRRELIKTLVVPKFIAHEIYVF